MSEMNEELSASVERLQAAFESIHRERFAGTALANEHLEVEVMAAGVVDTSGGARRLVVVVTPWTLNGLVLPGEGLPTTLLVAGQPRAVTLMDVPEIGQYAQVNLVPDVSKYTNHRQAHTIAQSLIEPFAQAISAC